MNRNKNGPVTCENILKLKSCEKMELIAGTGGLYRLINGVHYIEDFEHADCVEKGELIIVWGLHLKSKEKVIAFINKLVQKDAAGIIVYRSSDGSFPYFDEIISLGNSYNVCIFSMPYDVRLVDITQCICEAIFQSKVSQKNIDLFFYELINEEIKDNEYLLKESLGFATFLSQYYCVSVIKVEQLIDFFSINNYQNDISNIIHIIGKDFQRNILHMVHNEEIVLLISLEEGLPLKDEVQSVIKAIIVLMRSIFISCNISVGISEKCASLASFKTAYLHAYEMSNLALFLKKGELFYIENNMLSLLINLNNKKILEDVYYNIVGRVIEYDKKYNSNLLYSLWVFVECNYDSLNTANALFIHINTLRYRLNKIQELLSIKLRDPNEIYRIKLSYDLSKYIDYLSTCTH